MSPAGDPVEHGAAVAAVVAQWEQWMQTCTDRLLALDERAKANAADDDQRLLAAMFVARKSVAARLGEIAALAAGRGDRQATAERAAALFAQPLIDDLGRQVGRSVAEVAGLIDTTLDDVDRRLQAAEHDALTEAHAATSAAADLAIATPLAVELGSEVRAATALAQRLTTRDRLTDVAAEAAALRQRMQALAAERDRATSALALSEHRLAALRGVEDRVRRLAATCRDKIANPPRLAVPSVDRLGQPPTPSPDVPWTAQRGGIVAYLERLDRLEQALAEAERRLQAPLTRREELRGLLQAFRDKAGATGGVEDAQIQPLYRAAADLLWTAPCDVDNAGPAVQAYIDAVNRRAVLGGRS